MKLTNPQLATLADYMRQEHPFIGTVDLRHICGIDPEDETGIIDVRLYDDTEEIYSFEINTVGHLCHYA